MGTAATEDAVEAAWRKVMEAWDDERAHKQFLALCSTTGQLAEAGRRYREIRDRDPSRRDAAAKRIDAILGLAMKDMAALRTPPRQGRGWLFWVAFLLCAGLVSFGVMLVLRAR